jgi:hypothetical protein
MTRYKIINSKITSLTVDRSVQREAEKLKRQPDRQPEAVNKRLFEVKNRNFSGRKHTAEEIIKDTKAGQE